MGVCFFDGRPASSEHGDICSFHERKLLGRNAEILRTRPIDVIPIAPVRISYQSWAKKTGHRVEEQGPITMGQPPMHEAKRYVTVR